MKVELYEELSKFVLLIKIKMLLSNKKESKCSMEQYSFPLFYTSRHHLNNDNVS